MQVEWRCKKWKTAGEWWSNMVVSIEGVQQMPLFVEKK